MKKRNVKNRFSKDIRVPKKQTSILENITTIDGVNHFSAKRGLSSKLWLALLVLNGVGTVAFLLVIKERYNNDQIVTQINSDCKVNQVPFPAVSICNFNLVSLKETGTIASILTRKNRTQIEIEDFFRDSQNLKHFGVNSRKVGNYTEVMNILKDHYFNTETIMENVHQKCENLLLYCEFNGKVKNCAEIFNMIQTYDGHCCTFNYKALDDDFDNPMLPQDQEFEYYYDQNTDEKTAIITTGRSGRSSGLRVLFDVEPNDYPRWSLVKAYGATILLSDPNDFPETSVIYRFVTIGESMHLKVAPLIYQSDYNVRQLSPQKRGCWFHDEVDLMHTDRYSYETCKTECRMSNYLKFCGCIPYKYPRDKSTRVCDIADLPCLNNMTVYWSPNLYPCDPECFKECRDKAYSMTSDTLPFLRDLYPEDIINNRNISELSSIHVYFAKSTCNCYKLALLIDFNYFIATYGGVLSLTFGLSLISLFEIFYLLLISATTMLWRYVTTYKRSVDKVK